MYYNNQYFDENLPSEDESNPIEEHQELIENETHFDKYYDAIKETHNDLTEYIKYNAQNKGLLKNLSDYMFLEPLFDNFEIDFSDRFLRKIEKNDENDIEIIEPIDILQETEKYTENFVTLENKKSKRTLEYEEKTKKRKQRIKLMREKRERKRLIEERKKMTQKTKDIMKSYGFM